ncbi:MAG TPA: hypothetical protein VK864_06400 [Longimicrobiales bacterium]|nr:hypothetical protein [Longimicrobiales bacterium]
MRISLVVPQLSGTDSLTNPGAFDDGEEKTDHAACGEEAKGGTARKSGKKGSTAKNRRNVRIEASQGGNV